MFEIIAGDLSEETVYVEYPQPYFVYPEGELKHPFLSGLLGLKDKRKKVEIPFNNITEYEIATEESVKRMGGAIGWGAAGALLFGSVGLLAGVMAGGNTKEIIVVGRLTDGRKFVAKTDSKTHSKILGGLA